MDVRILMFAPHFAPSTYPEAIVNSKLVLAMLHRGHEVDVISRRFVGNIRYEYLSEWIAPWDALKTCVHPVEYDPLDANEFGLYRRFLRAAKVAYAGLRLGHPIVGCRVSMRELAIAMTLHAGKKYDVILSRAIPEAAHLPAMAMAKQTRLPWVANWNDATSGKDPAPYGRGAQAKSGFFADRFLAHVAAAAAWHTFPCDRLRRYICRYLGDRALERSSAIPHVAIDFPPHRRRAKSDVFTLCHAGSLHPPRDPEVLLKAMRNLRDSRGLGGKLRLRIIGIEGPRLREAAAALGMENTLEFAGRLGYFETLASLQDSDVQVIVEGATAEGIHLPSKFIDYVQVGRPILSLSPAEGTLRDILGSCGGGFAADCTSEASVTTALEDLHSRWLDETLQEACDSRRLYSLFAPDAVVDSYEKLFHQLGV
jgi:glycosyltransferase involved in cell wall biosynthesis